MTVDTFWMVHRLDEVCGPSRAHPTYPSAAKEAERLALKHPGNVFVVLKALRTCCIEEPARWEDCV